MKYHNPIIPGFYPDPSICRAKDTYYLVTSSFEYFPGIPIFKSKDLINWTSLGSVLTRGSQLPLHGSDGHGGIYAPTIRYFNGVFYVVTTNVDHGGHFYVTTTDPEKGWSEPIYVDQEGIDPSLFFEGDQAYFLSTAQHDGKNAILMSKLDIHTGKVSEGHYLWYGNGGRYLEGPHLYKIDGYYYILASEGGTEYGHMLVAARSKNIFGPYESCPDNPILTNRDMGGYQLQGAGHGDLVEDNNGNWWVVFLAFRQLDRYMQYHVLGREVNLLPVEFIDGWPHVGDGQAHLIEETDRLNVEQKPLMSIKQDKMKIGKDWFFLRNPNMKLYDIGSKKIILKASEYDLSEKNESPTVILTRQRSFNDELSVTVDVQDTVAGVTAYLEPDLHYDLIVYKKDADQLIAQVRLVIGPAKSIIKKIVLKYDGEKLPKLRIKCSNKQYSFEIDNGGRKYDLGSYDVRYLSSEVGGDFTGVMLGMFVESGDGQAVFSDFEVKR